MKLNELVRHIDHTGASDAEITAITYDSRKAGPGSLFVCLVGAWMDGHTFARSAYDQGCRAFLAEHPLDLPEDAAQIITRDTRAALAVIGADFYGNPADQLHILGITGTKGKTTTALLTAAILTEAGLPCAYIGSNGVNIAGTHEATANTTPESLELHRLFRKMLDADVHHVVLEVSSQALRHHRVDGIPFEVVAFTNLSEDHIGPGEHPDFEDYKAAKRRLFAEYHAREMVYNADDEASDYMRAGFGGKQVSFGIDHDADYRAVNLAQYRSETALGIDFTCRHGGEETPVRVMSPGAFSASDALCAIALCGGLRRDARPGRQNPGPHPGGGPLRGGGGASRPHLHCGLLPQRAGPDQRPENPAGLPSPASDLRLRVGGRPHPGAPPGTGRGRQRLGGLQHPHQRQPRL